MKLYKLLFIGVLLFAYGCKDGYLDAITAVNPGPDETAPVVTINYPLEGSEIKVFETVTSVNIDFKVTDDIEVKSITLSMDGSELANYTEFKDYRNVFEEYLYDALTDGDHTLTITATDGDGKTTTESVNFSKVPPYIKKYDGEVFYMPFDGDDIELVSVTYPTEVGNFGYAGEGKVGGNAYAGAADSYLTFPASGLMNNEFSAVFWMKINAVPDRAGILVIGPTDEANPDAENLRTSGFRFFRENAGGMQRFKLNVGTGASESWFDGGAAADVNPNNDEWVHMAFTISGTDATVYINGAPVAQGSISGIDWTGCDIMSIMSGAPHFTGWGHLSDESYMDELRIFNKALSQSEIQGIIADEGGINYQSEFGEIFYMPFEGNITDVATGISATAVGSPGFASEGLRGSDAYAGATDSYITYPAESLENDEFSASFWYKMNNDPNRAGILVIGPPDPDNPDAQNVRTSGFRFFREDAGGMQRFKLNVGTGASESWFDGGVNADLDPVTVTDWIHMAFTISGTEAVVYIDGEVVAQGTLDGVDWTDCDILSIGSGAPRFTGWGHLSDLSYIDELRIFDKALTQTEVQAIRDAQ